MQGFGPDTPVVLPEHVLYREQQRWLLWPALRYRVVSPLVHEERLNVFQSAVLGLARAGFREALEMGNLLGLESELVDLVRSDLQSLGYLDQYGVITDTGRKALHDGFPDPTRAITTYVYQDVMTGSLWPVSTMSPTQAQASWHRTRRVTLQLRTAGAPLRVSAFPVVLNGWAGTDPPDHEQVIEAVSRGEKAKRQSAGRNRRWAVPAPDRVVSRVSLMTSGVAVWIPVPLLLDKRGPSGAETVSWDARNPFTGRASTYLRKLVATRVQHSASLREHVDQFVGRRSEALVLEYDLLDIALRRRIAEVLENRFTSQLREHGDLVELLTLLERDIDQARRAGDGSPALGDVTRNAWRLHEAILRDVVARHRPSAEVLAGLSDPLARQLGAYCRQLGMPSSEQVRISSNWKAGNVRAGFAKPADAKTPVLLAAALVSAANGGDDHPFRRLAAGRPNLLTQLTNLSQDRNKGAHAQAVLLNLEHGETAWRLAQDTTAAYLGLPLPDLTTPFRKDRETDVETV